MRTEVYCSNILFYAICYTHPEDSTNNILQIIVIFVLLFYFSTTTCFKNMLRLLSFLFVFSSILNNPLLLAQHVGLSLQSVAAEQGYCYHIVLHSDMDQSSFLSSQNYRLYYDASVLQFDRKRAKSLLIHPGYSQLKVLQAVHNSNAMGFGGLEFGSTLGYINIAINDNMEEGELASLASIPVLNVAELCFDVMNKDREPSIIWARDPLTSGYSSAYTEVAISRHGKTILLNHILFHDLDASWPTDMDKMAQTKVPTSNH